MRKSNNAEFRKPDILIKDTQIVDGTGKPAYKGNLAIQGERILASATSFFIPSTSAAVALRLKS